MVSLNPISIADIILLLIIFFLLTSTYVLEPGIRVKLPGAKSAEVISKKEIVITITREGRIFLNEDLTDLDNLEKSIKIIMQEDPNRIIILRADRGVTVEELVRIMDIARGAGGRKFLIATQKI